MRTIIDQQPVNKTCLTDERVCPLNPQPSMATQGRLERRPRVFAFAKPFAGGGSQKLLT